jgi:hypothetical protein
MVGHKMHISPQHPSWTGGKEGMAYCTDCHNRRYYERRAARKAQLAARPKDCVRCGKRPHTWTLAGWKLCGPCKTATLREHHVAASGAGFLGLLATSPMVDTSGWAGRQAPLTASDEPVAVVTVTRRLRKDEAQTLMYEVRATDGWIGHAWPDELKPVR